MLDHTNICIFQRIPKLQQEDQAIWWDTMVKMQKLFRKGAQSLYNSEKFDKNTMHNYFMSGRFNINVDYANFLMLEFVLINSTNKNA